MHHRDDSDRSLPTRGEHPHGEYRGRPDDTDPLTHWEARYTAAEQVWSGRVNATTADVVAGLPVGSAVELGCGEGGDAIWMATRGWRVQAVDLSPTAVGRAAAAARASGVADSITWVAHDLHTWEPVRDAPPGMNSSLVAPPPPSSGDSDPRGRSSSHPRAAQTRVDLVVASFFHSMVRLDRIAILRRAAAWIRPGGHLLLVSHAAPPPWSGLDRHDHPTMPTPEQELAELALPTRQWRTIRAEIVARATTDPDGRPAVIDDGVLLVQRTRD